MSPALPPLVKNQSPQWRSTARIAVLVLILECLPLRRAPGEDRVDVKYYSYQEENGRVKVLGSALATETDLSSTLTLKLGMIYNTISGASPTGAPVATLSRPTPGASTSQARSMSTVSGASKVSGGSGSSSAATTAPGQLPTGQVHDERYEGTVEVDKRFGDNVFGLGLYYSTERDYLSLAGTFNYTREFNKKNTVLNLGISYGADSVDIFSQSTTQGKSSVNFAAAVTQILDAKTVLYASLGTGLDEGYLGDGYKYAQVNGTLLPEERPRNRDSQVGFVSLTHFYSSLNGSVEGNYRLYHDSFGILSNTVSLSWHQKLGSVVLVSPFVRYFHQTAADFYDVTFTGAPVYYSADWRLSKMSGCSYGLQVSWTPREWGSLDFSYERYDMWGDDGKTSQQAYPSANIFTAGFRLRF